MKRSRVPDVRLYPSQLSSLSSVGYGYTSGYRCCEALVYLFIAYHARHISVRDCSETINVKLNAYMEPDMERLLVYPIASPVYALVHCWSLMTYGISLIHFNSLLMGLSLMQVSAEVNYRTLTLIWPFDPANADAYEDCMRAKF